MHIKQVYFLLSKQEEHISSSSYRYFVSKDQNTVRMLGSVHQVRRLNWNHSLVELTDLILGSTQITFVEVNRFKRQSRHVLPNWGY